MTKLNANTGTPVFKAVEMRVAGTASAAWRPPGAASSASAAREAPVCTPKQHATPLASSPLPSRGGAARSGNCE